jgi:alkylation response protein AidB-like acyl-CoA dehydrogenase
MDSAVFSCTTPRWNDDAKVFADVSLIAREQLAPAAKRIDAGYYPLDILANLGQAGAYAGHLDRYGARYGLAISAMSEISRHCGATGFITWAHDVCGLYMEQSGNPALLARLENHTAGMSFGGTGLSNPMKALTGIEKMALKAKKVPGGYSVNGTLPWVSHIAPGQYCGAIAAVDRDDGRRSHEIMFLLDLDERVHLRPCPKFSGMEGTSTWVVPLVDYFVSEEQMIADPARPFIQRIRGAFVLLQVGIAAGIIQGSIDSIREVESPLGHINQYLHDRPDTLQAEFDELLARTMVLAESPFDESKAFFLDVLDVRSQGAELCLKASLSALLHQGAKGYLMDASPQRRIREAHFVAIVTPAIKHLRWEMAKLMREEVPA